jgi:hypothetical protein
VHSEDQSLCVLERDHPSIADVIIFHSFMKRESSSTKSVNEALSLALSLDCVLERDHPLIAGVIISRSSMKS